ncbi:unnamed protein product, partial [Discosporangium mesarthrocarpum]
MGAGGSDLGAGKSGSGNEGEEENLVFEDPFGDEFEDEDVHPSGEDEDQGDLDEIREEEELLSGGWKDSGMDGSGGRQPVETKVWRADVDKLSEGEELEYDSTAYHMYHSIRPEWPCLSFDIVRDTLGMNRSRFPHTVFAVAGTQADNLENNRITVMKLSDLNRTRNEGTGDDEDSDEDLDETDDDPVLDHVNIHHRGGVNRVRSMPQQPNVVSSWSETSDVHIWDIKEQLASFEKGAPKNARVNPTHTFNGHPEEGFAMDWSLVDSGKLVTGDCGNYIYLTQPMEGGWISDMVPFVGHTASVEDLQWSPTEATVFVSCSADKTMAVWDTRRKNGAMLSLRAHDEDVNVVSWNRNVTYLLASGSDDGGFKIWDLRSFGKGEPVAQFRWHQAPITSIEWHPTDESMLAASGADNQLTLWDLSVEADEEAGGGVGAGAGAGEGMDLPPQLL